MFRGYRLGSCWGARDNNVYDHPFKSVMVLLILERALTFLLEGILSDPLLDLFPRRLFIRVFVVASQ